jgi:hypothetical protein
MKNKELKDTFMSPVGAMALPCPQYRHKVF